MFDLSLSKLVLIGAVALVVVGPEKLPKVARMAGTLLGRAQRYLNDVKSEVSREMALDDLHSLKNDLHGVAQEISDSVTSSPSPAVASTPYAHEAQAVKARNFRRNRNRLRQLARPSRP